MFGDTICLFIEPSNIRNQRVNPSKTSTSKHDSLGDLILDQKEEGVKFKKNMIIKSNTMNGEKAF